MVFAKIYVTGTCARVTELKKLTSGLAGVEILVDYEDHIWAGLSKTVVFRGIGEKDVLTDKTAVEIPWEVMDKPCKHLWVGFYGTDSDKNMIIPTVYADLGPVLPGADPSGDESTDHSLPVWAQLQNQIDDLRGSGSPGGGGGSGENGGYYTPSVKQPDSDTLQFDFIPSKAGMPAIEPVEVTLPAGPNGDDYTLTDADKKEIAEMAADLVEVPDSGGNVGFVVSDTPPESTSVLWVDPTDNSMAEVPEGSGGGIAVTGATVGQTVKISAVDENGVPTAWEPADFPSGGGESKPVYLGTVPVNTETTHYAVVPVKDYKKVLFIKERKNYASTLKTNLWYGIVYTDNHGALSTRSIGYFGTPGYKTIQFGMEYGAGLFRGWGSENNNENATSSVTISVPRSYEKVFKQIDMLNLDSMEDNHYGFNVIDPTLAFDGNETVHVWGWPR